jgi:hypothetical protein
VLLEVDLVGVEKNRGDPHGGHDPMDAEAEEQAVKTDGREQDQEVL